MPDMYDLVICGGTVHDGRGSPARRADVAVVGDRIEAVGDLDEGRVGDRTEVIAATGLLVTPGFVDAHTHYDGQVTWDPFLAPSTFHGVTTIVAGNCGVGFAPCKPSQRDWLIGLMEGVEDIPGTALHEGIEWRWETFPEYLDALDRTPLAVDVGTQVPHGAVRAYVMGARGPAHEVATPEEIDAMAAVVREAVEAGALGFSTSRTIKHRDSKGVITPSITAHADELVGIARALGSTGTGVLQGISDFVDFDAEFELFRLMAEASGRTTSITVEQQDANPGWWRQLLDGITDAQARGLDMRGQVPPRATGVLMGLTATLNPFLLSPTYGPLSSLPLEERAARMREPDTRAAILADEVPQLGLVTEIVTAWHKMFPLEDPPDYEPRPEDSCAGIAAREGRSPAEVAYDALLADDGHALLYHPLFNYLPGDLSYVREMMEHPHTVMGLSDGGAHCGTICDASFPTTLLQHWGRDRARGPRLPVEELVRKQTSETAALVGLLDRGVLEPGYKADINVIDFERLMPRRPTIVHDLPAGGRRLLQRADGYVATIVSGKVAFREGEATGQLNGRLVRGAQPAPARR
jgi:N-acyl-D-aspartate/D-glutamate deacylase